MGDREAIQNAPSKPYLTDEWQPTDAELWERVLMVARGDRREMTRVGPDGPRTIHAPNHGRGFRHWPNPKAVAWAVKQYDGYGGRWKGRDEKAAREVLAAFQTGVLTADAETRPLILALEAQGLVRPLDPERQYWDLTKVAGSGEDFAKKVNNLLSDYDAGTAGGIAKWMEATFRFKSPRTPKGQKDLKEDLNKLWWYLAHGGPSYIESIRLVWQKIEPKLTDVSRYFSDEGGLVIPDKIQIGSTTYLNGAGLDAKALDKYAKSVEAVLRTVRGWRTKALAGGLAVRFASPRDFNGTATGRYKSGEDVMLVRTTPAVLKRNEGYASFAYILIHELGHRYEYKNRLSTDFDRPHWWTTKYSHKEGEAFAELFALGHFHLTGNWDPAILARFEKEMS